MYGPPENSRGSSPKTPTLLLLYPLFWSYSCHVSDSSRYNVLRSSPKVASSTSDLLLLISWMSAKSILVFAVVVFICGATVVPHVGKIKPHVPRTYNVSLDDPLSKRWAPILHDYKHAFDLFMNYFDLIPFSKGFWKAVDWYAKNVFVHKEFTAEVEVVASLTGQPFAKIFFLNFMYEFSTLKECSGILVRDVTGKILHGRNLDFFMWDLLAKLVVNVQYFQGSKRVYSVDTIVGSVFALTGIKHGAFAINVDTRKVKGFYKDIFNVLIEDAIPTVWLLRKVLEEETTYQGALERLKTTRIGGPVYYIISGTKGYEGAVIERDSDAVHGFYTLNETNWFLVQTNYDRDQPDPVHDPRRVAVENRIREHGQAGFTEHTLFEDFMTEWPTFNIATIMTAIMIPANGYHNTTVWYSYNPSEYTIL